MQTLKKTIEYLGQKCSEQIYADSSSTTTMPITPTSSFKSTSLITQTSLTKLTTFYYDNYKITYINYDNYKITYVNYAN
jgi:hypothetical protein